jgi:hypothetical protein
LYHIIQSKKIYKYNQLNPKGFLLYNPALDVNASLSADYGANTIYMSNFSGINHSASGAATIGTYSGFWGYAIRANGWIYSTQGYMCSSDARIKNIIGISDGSADLNKIMKIEITDYKMRDLVRDEKQYKKVIAQQVEAVYPQAVSKTTNTVPDIYQLSQISNGFISLKTDLRKGDKVKLIFDKESTVSEVISVTENGFTVDQRKSGKVFVYGREVNDFRTVDYDALSMLNISATQELARKIMALEKENTEEKTTNTELSNLVKGMKAQLDVINDRLNIKSEK